VIQGQKYSKAQKASMGKVLKTKKPLEFLKREEVEMPPKRTYLIPRGR